MIALKQNELTPDIDVFLQDSFRQHSTEKTGTHGRKDAPVSFTAYDGDRIAGAVVVQIFWGQLHVKNVMIDAAYRGKGIAQDLMDKAHAYGIDKGCDFAFVETLSFQAEGFYHKLGYATEFTRDGFAENVKYHYMKKMLGEKGHA